MISYWVEHFLLPDYIMIASFLHENYYGCSLLLLNWKIVVLLRLVLQLECFVGFVPKSFMHSMYVVIHACARTRTQADKLIASLFSVVFGSHSAKQPSDALPGYKQFEESQKLVLDVVPPNRVVLKKKVRTRPFFFFICFHFLFSTCLTKFTDQCN